MQPMEVFRNWQIDSLQKFPITIKYILEIAPLEDLKMYRDGGDGWTALEVLCHLRDFEEVFFERARLTMEQNFPDLPVPDPNQMAIEHDYNNQLASSVYDKWVENRQKFIEFLKTINEYDWERSGNHPRRGRFTLNDQLMLTAWHDMNHLEQMTRALLEKKS